MKTEEQKDKDRMWSREWKKNNPDRVRAYKKKYRASHKEHRAEYNKNYLQYLAEQHPSGYISDEGRNGENSGAWKGGANPYPKYTEFMVNRIIALKDADWRCDMCGKMAKTAHHLDGSKDNHDTENLLPVCHECHLGIFHSGNIRKHPNMGEMVEITV